MQQAGVIGVPDILGVKLPVVRQHLAVAAEQPDRPAQHAGEPGADFRTEPVFQAGHVRAEGAEHQPRPCRHAQLARPVPGLVEALRHAAGAVYAALEGHAAQIAFEVVVPGVIDALDAPPAPAFAEADERAAMGAAVLERMQPALPVAADDHRRLADEGGSPGGRLRQLRLHAEEMPGRAAEQALLLRLVKGGVAVNLEGHAREARTRPGRQSRNILHGAAIVTGIAYPVRAVATAVSLAATLLPGPAMHRLCRRGARPAPSPPMRAPRPEYRRSAPPARS